MLKPVRTPSSYTGRVSARRRVESTPPTRTIVIRLAIGVVGGGSEARYKGVGNLQREWGGAGRLLSGVAFAAS
jgi:hypothetical protein